MQKLRGNYIAGSSSNEIFEKEDWNVAEDLTGKRGRVGLSLKLILWGRDGFGLHTLLATLFFPVYIRNVLYYDVKTLLPVFIFLKFCLLC